MTSRDRLDRIGAALGSRTPLVVERRLEHRDAAVALVLRATDDVELLLIQRARHAHDPWSGHMALPGGRRAPGDADLAATALRETEEETGLPISRIGTLLGPLDEVAPLNPRLPPIVVAPFVVQVPAACNLRPDPREVAAALWIPLAVLRDPATLGEIVVDLSDEGSRRFPSFRYGDRVIWGLTYRILDQFLEIAAEAGG
jgi:8-oxo-dGTP pyrophosphatase MutT (NUDIX family)